MIIHTLLSVVRAFSPSDLPFPGEDWTQPPFLFHLPIHLEALTSIGSPSSSAGTPFRPFCLSYGAHLYYLFGLAGRNYIKSFPARDHRLDRLSLCKFFSNGSQETDSLSPQFSVECSCATHSPPCEGPVSNVPLPVTRALNMTFLLFLLVCELGRTGFTGAGISTRLSFDVNRK